MKKNLEIMPGHVKLGKTGEPDPDPSPYLIISNEMKREAMSKPYDAKKSVWVPDGAGGFMEAMLESESGGKTTVMCGHEKKTFKADLVGQVRSIFVCNYVSYLIFRRSTRQSSRSAKTWPT